MLSNFNLSTRRAPRSRSLSLFSADMPARPPSSRAPSPGGRPPRSCTSSLVRANNRDTPWTAGRRDAARRRSVIPRGRPAPPRPAEGTRELAPHGRPRRARTRPAGDPCGPAPQPHQQLADSPRASYGKTDRRGAPVQARGPSGRRQAARGCGTRQYRCWGWPWRRRSGGGGGGRARRRGAAAVPMATGRAGERNDARVYLNGQ